MQSKVLLFNHGGTFCEEKTSKDLPQGEAAFWATKLKLCYKPRIFTVKTGKLSGFMKKRIKKQWGLYSPKRMDCGAIRAIRLASFVLDVIPSTLLIGGED